VKGDGEQYIASMLNATQRMQVLINDLLMFSRVATRGEPFVPVDLNETVRGVVSDLEVRIGETNAIVDVGDLPTIDADPTQMRQLMQNLIGNALKFTRDGEPPHVRVFAEPEPVTDADSQTRAVSQTRILVADNGIGFDEKFSDRIFEVFQRLHGRDEYTGTGIGLAVCRRIVERHGGTIAARSKPEQGATFVMTLPTKQTTQQ